MVDVQLVYNIQTERINRWGCVQKQVVFKVVEKMIEYADTSNKSLQNPFVNDCMYVIFYKYLLHSQ